MCSSDLFPSHDKSGGSFSNGGTNDSVNKEIASIANALSQANMGSQQKFNKNSMLMQMGYNTLGAIQQGVYNHIEQQTAMKFNSAEAAKTELGKNK